MISCDVQIRVRYGETDRMGYAYYGFYPLYYEVGRTELLRQYGLAYKDIEDSGVLLPVADMHIDYYAPAIYDEVITVRTTITEKPGVKILFLYELFNSKNELINKATTTLVFVRASDRKPCRPPKTFNDIMEKAFKM
jgi:acyl-CoA thioester hydrolase